MTFAAAYNQQRLTRLFTNDRLEQGKPNRQQAGSNREVPQARFEHFIAHPGPVLPQNFGDMFPAVEGTKEQRMARMREFNGGAKEGK